jgi:hypothetical protein
MHVNGSIKSKSFPWFLRTRLCLTSASVEKEDAAPRDADAAAYWRN